MKPRLSTLLLLMSGLAGCTTVGPDYAPPETTVAAKWISPVDEHAPDQRWWQGLNDPTLTRLVELALAGSLDLREAEARLREARAQRDAVRGQSYPELTAQGSVTENRLSKNGQLPIGDLPGFDPTFSLFDLGFDASWEIDLWGRNRRATEGADARAQAAEDALRGATLSLIAEVCRTYVDLRAAQARQASARADATAQAKIAQLVGERYRAGEASRFDFARADAQAQSTASIVDNLAADARSAAYRIAVLTGRPPEAVIDWLLPLAQLPEAPGRVSAGLRSDLLRRRPDIRQAERELAASVADIGVATADLFPRFSLMGSVGQQSRTAGDLSSDDSTRFQIGPALHWPIFSGGRMRTLLRAADARSDAALARYERAVLSALSDSETALNRLAAAQATQRKAVAARDQTSLALDLARQRYRAGEDDLVVLLNAQSAFSAAERQSIDAHAAELAAFIAANKALGGGWETAP